MKAPTSFKRGGTASDVGFNMTPMIDCTFQLIIFFMLASQAASEALAQVKLAKPAESQALLKEGSDPPNKVIVNVVSADFEGKDADPLAASRAKHYKIFTDRIEIGDEDRLAEIIRKRKTEAESKGYLPAKGKDFEFYIEIRADKRVNYQDIAPVIKAGVAAGVSKMCLTALPATG